MVNQHIVEDKNTRSLKEFAEIAIPFLEKDADCDEVVQLADHITELANDKSNPPRYVCPLPDGYEYNFSGTFGQVIGIGRTGIGPLHKIA